RTGATGFLDADFALSDDAPTGTYAIEVRLAGGDKPAGRTGVRVEAFVPDRIEAKVDLPAGPLALGASVPAVVRASLLSGDPAPSRAVHLAVRCEPTDDAPVAGYVFGDSEESV